MTMPLAMRQRIYHTTIAIKNDNDAKGRTPYAQIKRDYVPCHLRLGFSKRKIIKLKFGETGRAE